MITSFQDSRARGVFHRLPARGLTLAEQRAVLRNMLLLDGAAKLGDLRSVPGGALTRLEGEKPGRYSLRVNEALAITFTWQRGEAADVGLTVNR